MTATLPMTVAAPSLLTLWIRRCVPRALLNAVRRPRSTLSRLGARLRHLLGQTAEITLLEDFSIRCHPMCPEIFRLIREDPEQRAELETFGRLMPPGAQVLDIGAHWGVFALAALHYGGDTARVICCEPSPAACAILQENLALNDGTARAKIITAAIGRCDGSIAMLTTGSAGADYYHAPDADRPDTIEVPLLTVQTVCARHAFDPTHLKIDVEGYEEDVLHGAVEVLQHCKPVVFLELHGPLIERRGKQPAAVLDLLEASGYCHWLSVSGQPLDRRSLAACGYETRMIVRHGAPPPDHET